MFNYKVIKGEWRIRGGNFFQKLKFKKSIQSHDKFLRVEIFGKGVKVNRCKIIVQIMSFVFPAHVANSVSDGSGIIRRWFGVVIFPFIFNLIDYVLNKLIIQVKRSLGDFLQQDSAVNEVEGAAVPE